MLFPHNDKDIATPINHKKIEMRNILHKIATSLLLLPVIISCSQGKSAAEKPITLNEDEKNTVIEFLQMYQYPDTERDALYQQCRATESRIPWCI